MFQVIALLSQVESQKGQPGFQSRGTANGLKATIVFLYLGVMPVMPKWTRGWRKVTTKA